jgi:hypothetical protein
VKNRKILEGQGVKFADLSIAKFFSHETAIKEVRGMKAFAFHKWMGENKKYPRFSEY